MQDSLSTWFIPCQCWLTMALQMPYADECHYFLPFTMHTELVVAQAEDLAVHQPTSYIRLHPRRRRITQVGEGYSQIFGLGRS